MSYSRKICMAYLRFTRKDNGFYQLILLKNNSKSANSYKVVINKSVI